MRTIHFATLVTLAAAPTAFGQARGATPVVTEPGIAATSPASTGYFTGADGVRLFYRKLGRGSDVLVCVHGGPGLNLASGCLDMDPLARGRTLIMYDQRGSGRSELVADSALLTAAHHVRDLEALRRHFHIQRMSLVGVSWGSALAALYAMEHPERVERLLLVAPMPPARTPYWEQRVASVNAVLGSADAARMNEIMQRIPQTGDEETVALCHELRFTYRAYLANPANIDRVRDRCAAPAASIRNGLFVSRATLNSLGDWDLRPRLRRLRMPALVIEGAETNVPLEATRAWAATMPNARLLLLADAGHELWAEQPDAFLRAAGEFLGRKYPAGAKPVRDSAASVSASVVEIQQLDSAQREVWRAVEDRWRAWQAGDLSAMLERYHRRFHAWNRVTGRLDGRDDMLARWRSALATERILAVKLEPTAVELFGDFAAAYYVTRETVQQLSTAPAATDTNARTSGPTVVAIRWSDYLVREGGRWLFVGYSGVPCSPSEAAGSMCRSPAGK